MECHAVFVSCYSDDELTGVPIKYTMPVPVRFRVFRENRANFSAKLVRIDASKLLNY